MVCNLRQNELIKDFTLYHLFKMQPNALLIRQNFMVIKSGCYSQCVNLLGVELACCTSPCQLNDILEGYRSVEAVPEGFTD
jgi:hypothetical protein